MSLRSIVLEIAPPYLQSIGAEDVDARIDQILATLRNLGAAVPGIAASLEANDLESTGLPAAVRRQLASRLREDVLPKTRVSNDPMARLRPGSFDHVIGHEALKELLTDAILAARNQDKPLRHILFTGPRGLGKTTLALSIAYESSRPIRTLVGAQLKRAVDVTMEVMRWKSGEIIFIDEIHGMGREAQETLYSVMEDGRLPIVEKRKGGVMFTSNIACASVTIVGATTNPARLLAPFRNRFGTNYTLPFYTTEEMVRIGFRSAQILNITIDDDAMRVAAVSSRDNPRSLNEFLIQLADRAHARGKDRLTLADAQALLQLTGYDSDGLRREERVYVDTLQRNGGSAGLATMASALDMEVSEVEATVEPWLIRQGWIQKTARGRKLVHKEGTNGLG